MSMMTTVLRPEERSATIPPAAAAASALHGALLESRQRWQDLTGLGWPLDGAILTSLRNGTFSRVTTGLTDSGGRS